MEIKGVYCRFYADNNNSISFCVDYARKKPYLYINLKQSNNLSLTAWIDRETIVNYLHTNSGNNGQDAIDNILETEEVLNIAKANPPWMQNSLVSVDLLKDMDVVYITVSVDGNCVANFPLTVTDIRLLKQYFMYVASPAFDRDYCLANAIVRALAPNSQDNGVIMNNGFNGYNGYPNQNASRGGLRGWRRR